MNERTASGLFTLGVAPERYQLPHPCLGLPVILLVRKVILRALEILREEKFQLTAASEDEVTAAIKTVIESNLRQSGSVAGFNRHTYDTVVRQAQVANFDGTRITKTPDLCFNLRNDEGERSAVLSEYDALFIECKPVDATHSAGGKYCDDGLCRFVRGDYAWAMQEAMMLAYARNGRSIAKHLLPAMSEPARFANLQTDKLPQPIATAGAAATNFAEIVHVSRHRRDFPWPHGKGQATPIDVFHVWCQCG
jgi:hypothetical protein